MVLAQNDATGNQQSEPTPNHTLIANLAKANLWQEQLESGEYSSFDELAQANKVDRTYVARMLRLTSLAPKIVEQIVYGQDIDGLSLRKLLVGVPMVWSKQF
jgi:hypothetical protein